MCVGGGGMQQSETIPRGLIFSGKGGGYKAGQNFFVRQEFFRNFLLPFSTWALKTYDKALQICIKKQLFFPKKKFLPAPHPSEGD